MRSKSIEIAGKDIVIRERKIGYLKETLLPKIEPAWGSIVAGEIMDLVDNLGAQMVEIFPELQGIELEECYPSEIEDFMEAWIDVNFTGLKRLLKPLWSLIQKGKALQESDAAGLLDSQSIGRN